MSTTALNIGRGGDPRIDGRLPAFVGLAKRTGGVYLETDDAMTAPEALHLAGLDFEVQVHDTPTQSVLTLDGVTSVEYPGHRGVVAHYPDGRLVGLGIVKSKFVAVQNTEAAEAAQVAVDDLGANVVAVGAYGDPIGAKTYMALKLPEGLTIAGQDRHDVYLQVINAHDGTGGLKFVIGVIRFTCTNQTLAVFGRGAPHSFNIRHTASAKVRMDEVRTALGLVPAYLAALQATQERMLQVRVTSEQFDAIIAANFPAPTSKGVRSQNAHANRVATTRELFLRSDTNEFGRGSALAGYNASVEYLDWYSPTRGDRRDVRVVSGELDRMKASLWQSFASLT